jgi:uncharacterized protein YndB with AHSA1/START domain
MRVEVSVEITRPPDIVWPVLVDVEHWPEWTASITKIERLDQAAFGLGSAVRIHQPKLKAMTYRVCKFEKGRLFAWETQSSGVFTIASHVIHDSKPGCLVTLAIYQRGWAAPFIAPFLRGITRRYVEMEAHGLKKTCEELP